MTSHQLVLFLHLFAVALSSGVGFINLWGLWAGRGQSADILKGIAFQQRSLRKVGYIIVSTIFITGIWATLDLGGFSAMRWWFHAKLFFVMLWLVAYAAMRLTISKMVTSGDVTLARRINLLAHLAWTSAALAMLGSVMAFAD